MTTAAYEDGTIPNEESIWNWTDIDFDYDEETDTYLVPKGWWEYRHFNPDEVYNNKVDEDVVAWMPLPEPYKEGVKEDMCLKKANKKESITVKEWIDIIKEVDGKLKDIIKTANAKG